MIAEQLIGEDSEIEKEHMVQIRRQETLKQVSIKSPGLLSIVLREGIDGASVFGIMTASKPPGLNNRKLPCIGYTMIRILTPFIPAALGEEFNQKIQKDKRAPT